METALRPVPSRHGALSEVAAQRLGLALVLMLGALPYLGGLGLYLDDWTFAGQEAATSANDFASFYSGLASTANVAVRPLQIVLYWFYSLATPHDGVLFAHVFNHLLLLGAALAFHHGLRGIPATTPIAFPFALMIVSTPWFSTARMWLANHMATLSLLGFALALCATVRAWRHRDQPQRRVADMALLALACSVSLFSYELAGPVLPGLALFVWRAGGSSWHDMRRDRSFLATQATLGLALATAILFKIAVGHELVAPLAAGALFHHGALMAVTASINLLWDMGVALPWTALRAALGPFGGPTVVLAGFSTAVALLLIGPARIAATPPSRMQETALRAAIGPGFLLASGLLAFALGYAAFLPRMVYGPEPFGLDNRSNIGAAPGAVLILLSGMVWLDRRRNGLLGVLTALFCTCGVIVVASIGTSFVRAAEKADDIFADIVAAMPAPRPGTALLLEGECPYLGPAPLYPSAYGLSDRLRLQYRMPSLLADAVTPGTQVTAQGVTVREFGADTLYPYGQLLIYDRPANRLIPLASRQAATAWFADHPVKRSTPCAYREGGGTSLFQ
ncbi:MAG: hypothetical protein IH997_14645 [Proteobacteria bacterium]|nr:hypothetical protein [Pseudomonadota bacterium]